MAERGWSKRILFLSVVALVLIAVVLVYVTAPSPTVLIIHVLDHQTSRPLAGSQVQVRLPGQEPLPVANTGEDGLARFEDLAAGAEYEILVQKMDYKLAEAQLAVAQGQETGLAVPLEPRAGGRLFVGLNRPAVVKVDTASLLVLQTIVLPAAPEVLVRHLLLHPEGDLLYAIAGAGGYILSPSTGAVLAALEVDGNIDSLELSADGDRLLLAGVGGGGLSGSIQQRRLWMLDAQSGALITKTLLSAPAPGEEDGIVWRSDGNDLYILRATGHLVDAWAEGGSRYVGLSRAPLGGSRGEKVVLSADGEYVYQGASGYSNDTGAFTDVVFMTAVDDGAAVYQEVPLGTSAMAASPLGLELYVLNAKLGTLTILDLTGAKPQTLLPVGKQPEALIVSPDGRRIYVADRAGEAISVIDAELAEVMAAIRLRGEPLSMAVK